MKSTKLKKHEIDINSLSQNDILDITFVATLKDKKFIKHSMDNLRAKYDVTESDVHELYAKYNSKRANYEHNNIQISPQKTKDPEVDNKFDSNIPKNNREEFKNIPKKDKKTFEQDYDEVKEKKESKKQKQQTFDDQDSKKEARKKMFEEAEKKRKLESASIFLAECVVATCIALVVSKCFRR